MNYLVKASFQVTCMLYFSSLVWTHKFMNSINNFCWYEHYMTRDEKQQLLLGIRRANRQPANLSSSVLSSDSMHIGILAAAAHASANNSPFTVFYNPRLASLFTLFFPESASFHYFITIES